MKKSRNSFFNEYSNYQNPNMMMPNPYGPMPMNSDIEERLAKIERQINRLDHRINNIEKKTTKSINDIDEDDDMYMI